MQNDDFILASYLVTTVLVAWLVLSTWLAGRRADKALAGQDTPSSR